MRKWIPVITLLVILILGSRVSAKEGKYQVHFIDIGQSDCILIKGEKDNYLIDAGMPYTYDKVLRYLNFLGVEKINDIIITHYHDDHYGGLKELIIEKKVDRVMLPNHQSTYRDVLFSYLQDRNIKFEYITENYGIKDDGIDLKALLAKKEDKDIENNNSVVIAGYIDGVKYVFMADAEKAREKELIKNKYIFNCDVMKVGHHGLDTSTTNELVNTLNPKIAVITCDGGESPSNSVIDKLSKNGAAIFRTDMHGNIIIKGHPDDKAVEITTNKMIK